MKKSKSQEFAHGVKRGAYKKLLADTKKWKKLDAAIKRANKDPEFRESMKRFIKISSNHE